MIVGPTRRGLALALLTALAPALAGCSAEPGAEPRATADQGRGFIEGCPTAQPEPLPAGQRREVTIATELGELVLTIEADLSPIAAGNFVALASCGYYDGLVFHRVVPRFVIQGGDPTGTGRGGPGYTIEDEPVTARYGRGTVAMARTRQPDSVGSQFFIVLDDEAEPTLDAFRTYQIIGRVASGMDTADAIAAAADAENPSDPVVMTSVSVATP